MHSLGRRILAGFITIQIVVVAFFLLRNPFDQVKGFRNIVQQLNVGNILSRSNFSNYENTTQQSTFKDTTQQSNFKDMPQSSIAVKTDISKVTTETNNRPLTAPVTSLPVQKPIVKYAEYPYRTYNVTCRTVSQTLRNTPFTPDDAKNVLEWYKSVDDYFKPHRTDPINMPEDEGENLFLNYDYNKPSSHTLTDANFQYFHFDGDKISCYKRGTADIRSQPNGTTCICHQEFTGKLCSVPKTVENSRKNVKRQYTFKPRKVPRRIIFAMTFNMEHIILYLKMIQNAPAVDLFVLLESNFTNYGDPKPLYLLPVLKRGFMRRWHGKIMHMFTSEFLQQARQRGKGFEQENHIRGLFAPAIKQRVSNVRDDDLFLYFDADETPGLDELLFLKLHDGYPVPVGFHMILCRYGLYWWDEKVKWRAVGVAPMKMFLDVYSGHANILRGHTGIRKNKRIKNFGSDPLHEVWNLGSEANCVGWHLSPSGTPGQVFTKIMSVINADWPRFADNPVNRNITYIASLFRRGRFFDLKHDCVAICPRELPQFKDLGYIFKYPNYFNYLLVNPNLFIP
ncbi:beta-1,4-mannosyl-glycoprotein 4-beta-N-acetylglucosaminyltransferase-like [Gigantopelta aegis]|uniref:beta-1,4-mannosyl-glycoprotein 4-beta-N-acetylglucosaminyltransferase-like n=1 Tax=Gigantopelta aegis TaxID=1735272 RepID=UPI001B889FEA|nr:beta-1,4-mannosyl-glycoprotein 4-beta-N-acetylglucosaminyltransferase-like [Gigantopelta aegis]XP_041361454.1 beta-1,4-mannosyl-glycoprotein 4-beta-N-acetylglucosaminyltransferase-like [Gigantopelta aegis]